MNVQLVVFFEFTVAAEGVLIYLLLRLVLFILQMVHRQLGQIVHALNHRQLYGVLLNYSVSHLLPQFTHP